MAQLRALASTIAVVKSGERVILTALLRLFMLVRRRMRCDAGSRLQLRNTEAANMDETAIATAMGSALFGAMDEASAQAALQILVQQAEQFLDISC